MKTIQYLESGYDYITVYFKTHREMDEASKKVYAYMKRVKFKHFDLQRKNLVHKPGDIPHFHNGIEATKGSHFHVIYPNRPTESDWEELKKILESKLVNISLDKSINEEIS